MSVESFFGFDKTILIHCTASHQNKYKLLSWLFLFNIIIFAFGTYQFFKISSSNPEILYTLVFFFTYIFLSYTRMIIATHDHDIAYFNKHGKLAPLKHDISITLRMFMVFLFSMVAGYGILIWLTDVVFYDLLIAFSKGKYNNTPEILNYIHFESKNIYSSDSLTDRFKIIHVAWGLYFYLLLIPFFLTSLLFMIPFYLKFYNDEISNGEYEIMETAIERAIAISQYEERWDYVNWVRKEKYDLPAYRYEGYWDCPFNTIPRYPPLDKSYK
jgi:hypothetical protein